MRGKRFEQSGITEVKGKKMMISTKGRYALRVMADLAEHGPEYVSLSDVSARQAVSLKYLEAIIAALSRADFVESRRGKTGGYRLKKPVSAYTVGGILRAAEGNLTPVSCSGLLTPSSCSRAPSCPTFPLWKELERRVDEYLESVTLADLLEGNVKKI